MRTFDSNFLPSVLYHEIKITDKIMMKRTRKSNKNWKSSYAPLLILLSFPLRSFITNLTPLFLYCTLSPSQVYLREVSMINWEVTDEKETPGSGSSIMFSSLYSVILSGYLSTYIYFCFPYDFLFNLSFSSVFFSMPFFYLCL